MGTARCADPVAPRQGLRGHRLVPNLVEHIEACLQPRIPGQSDFHIRLVRVNSLRTIISLPIIMMPSEGSYLHKTLPSRTHRKA